MTLELIIGKAGTPHIDGNDIGTLNQAIRGAGSYILDWGNNLIATVTGSNTVQIGTGAGTMEGRDFIISAAENVTIQSGSQGMKRNDLICLHYNRSSSTGVETMNLVALKGYAVSSNPRDPSVPSGTIMGGSLDAYWPLYRVSLDGIRIGTPVRLAEMLPSLRNLHYRLDAAAQTTSARLPYMDRDVTFYKIGKIVTVSQQVLTTATGTNAHFTAGSERVPDGYRPANQGVLLMSDNTGVSASMMVNSLGQIEVNGTINGSRYLQVFGSWITA